MDDSVVSFPGWTKLALRRIFRCWSYLSKDEVSDVEFFQLHPLIVVFGYLLLVLGHPLGSLISDFVQEIEVLLQLVVVALFVKELSPKASESYFDRDDCFYAISQVEWYLSRRCSCHRPVCP